VKTHYPRSREEAVVRCREWLSKGAVFVDTETTGLNKDDEIIENCIVDAYGAILLDSLVKPTKPIPPEATMINGITNKDVMRAPKWPTLYDKVRIILEGRLVIAYNSAFDRRMVCQTNEKYGLAQINATWQCAMITYAGFRGVPTSKKNRFKHFKLGVAAQQMGIGIETELHRSKADCLLTLELVKAMAKAEAKKLAAGGEDWTTWVASTSKDDVSHRKPTRDAFNRKTQRKKPAGCGGVAATLFVLVLLVMVAFIV
jgi:DNA polymerase-3 subunit epsilon